MAKPFFPDFKAIQLVENAPACPEEAAQALLLAAEYIRKGEPLPDPLADYMADGIEQAMRNPARHDPYNMDRGRALLVTLNLEAKNRRPSKIQGYGIREGVYSVCTDNQVFLYMESLMHGDEKKSQNAASKLAAEKFDISESTAKRLYRKGRKESEEYTAWVNEDPLNRI